MEIKMNKIELYKLLNIKPYVEPERPKYRVIVSGEAKSLFKSAANAIEQNHPREYSISHSNLMLTKFPGEGRSIEYTIFITSTTPDILREMTIQELFVDINTMSANDLDYVKACLYPAAKKIIYIDNDSEE